MCFGWLTNDVSKDAELLQQEGTKESELLDQLELDELVDIVDEDLLYVV